MLRNTHTWLGLAFVETRPTTRGIFTTPPKRGIPAPLDCEAEGGPSPGIIGCPCWRDKATISCVVGRPPRRETKNGNVLRRPWCRLARESKVFPKSLVRASTCGQCLLEVLHDGQPCTAKYGVLRALPPCTRGQLYIREQERREGGRTTTKTTTVMVKQPAPSLHLASPTFSPTFTVVPVLVPVPVPSRLL
ncbi:hypothetical protein B0T24DRAFT_629150 [Lasiosphaeria ovina]|uniref:Uncharacterized protein n=1 Tax=Lasiosphaeria ovina TaxID=92902 RepID=A0AAE0K8Q6_9PEZI|nr:hypothetical protein B0T24DRAFT_629150 [Lasiosphaeria ovina]